MENWLGIRFVVVCSIKMFVVLEISVIYRLILINGLVIIYR